MIRYIGLRLAQAIPLVAVATFTIFVAVSLAGDPLDRYRAPNVPASTLAAKAAELGLNQPLTTRYWHWITGVLHGNFGTNAVGSDVRTELIDRSLVSLRLVTFAIVIAIVLAIVVGFVAAVRQHTFTERGLVALTVILLTAPEFWTAVIVKQGAITMQQHTGTDFISTVGQSSPDNAQLGWGARIGDYAGHLLLPTIVLVLASYPVWALYQRAAMLEVIDSDYITLARAKGLGRTRVMVRHGLRNALMPVITMIALRLPWIISGLVVVETIFGWQGLGSMLVEGIQKQDTNTVLAFMLLSAVLITVLNLAADIAHRFLDPRIRNA